jgi:hypothetical protein
MENNIPQFTFAIASKDNFRYVKYAVQYIRENCYRKDHFIHIGIDGEDAELESYYKEVDGIILTKGVSGIAAIYNDIVKKATTELILIYHADMIAGKDLDVNLYKHWNRGLIVSATRIEPPLHPEDPAKLVKDFGMWPEETVEDGFKKNKFDQFVQQTQMLNKDKITKGVFAPWLVHKQDYWKVGGHDEYLNSHSEDRDLFNRFLLEGFDFVQSWDALVYHLTCRGGQFEHAKTTKDLKLRSANWNELARKNTKEFLRKWGTLPRYDEYQYPIVPPKYDIGIRVKKCNLQLLERLEPWCSTILIEEQMHLLATVYKEQEQATTRTDLDAKIRIAPCEVLSNEILVEIDGNTFTQQDFQYIQQLNDIVYENNELGYFELGNLKITINSLESFEKDLIFIPNTN